MPANVKKYLEWSDFYSGTSKVENSQTNILLYGGNERELTFVSNFAYKEKHITKIGFTRTGEVSLISQYEKEMYDEKLRQGIVKTLQSNLELRKEEHRLSDNLDEFEAKGIADSLKYHEAIL